jgi:hypothetical protein
MFLKELFEGIFQIELKDRFRIEDVMKNEWVTSQGYCRLESCVKQGVVLVNEEEKQDLEDSELFDKYVVKV